MDELQAGNQNKNIPVRAVPPAIEIASIVQRDNNFR
jgi:hypothetical protein